MPEELLLEELETADPVAENLEKVEDSLRDARSTLGLIVELLRQKKTALAFENAWRKTITNVAKGLTAEMHAARPRLLSALENWLGLLTQAHTLLTRFHDQGWADLPDPDFLLPEIASMQRLKARVFDRWQSAEDLEDLAARDYPLTTADLDQIGPRRRPPTLPELPDGDPFWDLMKSIWGEQKARGHVPRSVEEVEAERRQMRAGWAERQETIERLQEESRRLPGQQP